jgi:hypothetical protein
MFNDRFVERICGSKRVEFVGGWRKLSNEEFNYLCSSSVSGDKTA